MPPDDSSVVFRTRCPALKRPALRDFVARLTAEVVHRPFHCIVTADAELRSLNRRFRGKDAATDVLAFPDASASESIGDVAVSYDRAKAQASEHGHTIQEEVSILILHGALHLAGHDHETDNGQMESVEAEWREKLALPAGLIQRSAR